MNLNVLIGLYGDQTILRKLKMNTIPLALSKTTTLLVNALPVIECCYVLVSEVDSFLGVESYQLTHYFIGTSNHIIDVHTNRHSHLIISRETDKVGRGKPGGYLKA